MAKVSYKMGTKQTYLSLVERDPYALYWCTDTKELFKGNDLYSDGIRVVANKSALPAFETAAEGILYFCEDTGSGYVLNNLRNAWINILHGVDNTTIEINEEGLLTVKNDGIATLPQLTELTEKVNKLEEKVTNLETVTVGGVKYKGSVATKVELPQDAKQGDLYEVKENNSEWCYNGTEWFEFGTTDVDRPLNEKYINKEQFELKEQVLNIKKVDASLVQSTSGKTMEELVAEVEALTNWEEM